MSNENKNIPTGRNKTDLLFIDNFKIQRYFLESAMALHLTTNMVVFINHKLQSNPLYFQKDKMKTANLFIAFYFGLTFVDDFIYCLFRKDKSDGMIKKFWDFQKVFWVFPLNINSNFSINNEGSALDKKEIGNIKTTKNMHYSSEKEKSTSPIIAIHEELFEIEKLEKEFQEKIKNKEKSELNYIEILNEIDSKRKRKEMLLKQISQHNKNLENFIKIDINKSNFLL
jgi:hypothetical protein